ncbi:hypothetical protein WUBG_01090 [Wuchereria bancrofti]|uniref:Uncharacterized protein n=2 Tax=Wuchereria bancrofti TaxID=6293 RepID=J9FKU7_WUCBA|nr:hypothetical protein WUBG_01090 [Wuchereria bancrofti]
MYFPPTILTIASHIAAAHMTLEGKVAAVALRIRTNRDVQSAPPVLVWTLSVTSTGWVGNFRSSSVQ